MKIYLPLEFVVAVANVGLTLNRVDSEINANYGSYIPSASQTVIANEFGDTIATIDRDGDVWMVAFEDRLEREESDS